MDDLLIVVAVILFLVGILLWSRLFVIIKLRHPMTFAELKEPSIANIQLRPYRYIFSFEHRTLDDPALDKVAMASISTSTAFFCLISAWSISSFF